MNRYVIRIPGYYVEATIDFPNYHPHTIWWLSYISRLLHGDSLTDLRKKPPWPNPKNKIIVNHIIKELIDQKWLIPDWSSAKFIISPQIQEIYKRGGDIALAQEFLKYDTVRGEWWIEAVSGIPMSVQKALKYDVEFGKKILMEIKELNPMDPDDLIDKLNLDIISLIRLLKLEELKDPNITKRAFLSTPLKLVAKKDIEFEMYSGIKGEQQRIIPLDLDVLEPMFWEHAPEIFGKKPKRIKRLFFWTKSIVEKFALSLEKFPNYVSLITSGQYFKYLIEHLKGIIERKEDWTNWYKNGVNLVPLAGISERFFDALCEICGGKFEINERIPKNSPERIIIMTSFLNPRNLYINEGLVYSLKQASQNAKVLVVYGHASDDPPEQQKKDMEEYYDKIIELNPSLKDRIKIIATIRRTHEKIILSSNGDWMVGSWNAGSSNPLAKLFETSVFGRDCFFSLDLLEKIKENIEDPSGLEFVGNFEENLKTKIKDPTKIMDLANIHYKRLKEAVSQFIHILQRIGSSENTQNLYENALYSLRLSLLPFLKRGRIKLINEHQSRDVLITQVKSSLQDIFLASDRVTKTALDRTLLYDIEGSSGESKRLLRILWGREWENERKLSKESKTQIKDARNAIKMAKSILRRQLKTSFNPMENHAKFALFDGCRGLITSENILSYGGEKGQYESRELGVFIESIPIIRHIEGRAAFYRLNHFHPDRIVSEMGYRPYEWIVFGSDNFFALEDISTKLDFDYSAINIIESAILDYLKNPDKDFDDFDKRLLSEKHKCYQQRKELIQDSFIEYLWREGMRYYLLKPNLEYKWTPFLKKISEKELESLEITKKFDQEGNLDLSIPQESSMGEVKADPTQVNSHKIHPIVKEIMDEMILIRKGSFLMGDPQIPEEKPVHRVEITQNFYMGKFIVTQKLWEQVMEELPIIRHHQKSPNFPIINVTYHDVQEFINKLNSLSSGGEFDLPADAQWEYACRAGSKDAYCFGNNRKLLNEYAWSKINSGAKLHEVGLKKPNKWGLYDMHGLVYELMKDDLRKYSKNPTKDPVGPLNTDGGIVRGGAWGRYPFHRNLRDHHFRCGRRLPNPKFEKSHRQSFRLIRKIVK